MKTFTYSEARRRLAAVLDLARKEPVMITRRGGDAFSLSYQPAPDSPFDVPGIKTQASMQDILDAISESRARGSEQIS